MVGGVILWWRSARLSELTALDYKQDWHTVAEALLLLSPENTILEANPAAVALLGEGIVGESLTAVLPPPPSPYTTHTLPLHTWRKQKRGHLVMVTEKPLPPPPIPPAMPLPAAPTDTAATSISPTIPYKVLRAIGELLEPEAVAYIAVQAIADFTHWPIVVVYTPDDENKLVIRAAVGIPFTDEGVIGRAYRTGHTQIIPEPQQPAAYLTPFNLPPSALAIPLRRGRKQLGVLLIEHDQPDAFSEDDILIGEALADAIVLALDNARLFTEAQNRLTEQSVLREAMSVISSTLDLNSVLFHLAEQVGKLMRATSVYICSYDAQQSTTAVLAEYYGSRASETERVSDISTTYYLPDEFPGTVTALEAGEPILAYVDDPALSPAKRQHLQAFSGYTSLVIPLQVGGKTIAYAEIWESQQRRTFTPAEIQLCQDIAHHAAIAIENARLFKAIADERSRLQALIESDRDGIILIGTTGDILVMNEPAHRFLHFDGPLEKWRNISSNQAIAYLAQKAPEIAQIAQSEKTRLIQGDTQPHEGEYDLPNRSIHWRSLPVIEEGEALSRLIVLRDITEERLLEKMREDLIHTMVHDLRSPLASISITLDLLNMYLGEAKEAKISRALKRAQTSSEHMLSIVNAILDISRLESGRVDLAYSTVTFTSIIDPVLEMHLPLTLEKQLQITRHFSADLPLIEVDAALIERVMQNLVGNAIKFTPAGGTIQIEAQPQADCLLVSVIDSGPGIPKTVQNRLFQKFSTGDHPQRGSGLGLAFCKMAVEAHQHRIWLAHSSSAGSTFQFTLPLADSTHS